MCCISFISMYTTCTCWALGETTEQSERGHCMRGREKASKPDADLFQPRNRWNEDWNHLHHIGALSRLSMLYMALAAFTFTSPSCWAMCVMPKPPHFSTLEFGFGLVVCFNQWNDVNVTVDQLLGQASRDQGCFSAIAKRRACLG